MARRLALAVALVAALLPVSGAGGADAQAPKRGGTVGFGLLTEPPCLNVLLAACTGSGEAIVYIPELILQPAFDVGPDYTFRPRLVSHVTYTRKPPFTLTYHIRRAAHWSDGEPITARDFLFTHQALLRSRAELPESQRDDIRRVRRVSPVDEKTLRVVLRARWSGWRSLFPNVLPAHALQGEDLKTIWSDDFDNPKTGKPLGSGPFLLESWDRGRQLTLVRNPRYWAAHRAYLDRIVVRFQVESENPVDWFRNGEIDVAYGLFAPSVPALRREPGVRVFAEPSATYQSLAFRIGPGGHPALRMKLVRRALAYAVDRPALIGVGPSEIDPNLRPLQSLLHLVQSPYYRPHWSQYRSRPELAGRLFERAGCRQGSDGIYSCAGERLSLRLVTTAGNPGRARVLLLAQVQLRRSGVEALATFEPPGTFFGKTVPGGDFDIALYGFTSTPNSTGSSIFGCGGSTNFTGYCQRLVTKDLDQADRILDPQQLARVLNRADAQLARDMPVLPLFQVPIPTAVRDTVKNFSQSLNPLTNAENWWLDD